MDKIYCLMTVGGSIDETVGTTLFNVAQDMMQSKSRRLRLKKAKHGIEGEITTRYKFQFMGSVGGIEFAANFDTEDQTIKAAFIARPLTAQHEGKIFRWKQSTVPPSFKPASN